MVLAGTSLVTTAPAPMMVWGPMVTPSRMVTFEPIQTSSPMVMPRAVWGCWKIGCPGRRAVVEREQRRVRADPDPVADRDPAADRRERVDRSSRTRARSARSRRRAPRCTTAPPSGARRSTPRPTPRRTHPRRARPTRRAVPAARPAAPAPPPTPSACTPRAGNPVATARQASWENAIQNVGRTARPAEPAANLRACAGWQADMTTTGSLAGSENADDGPASTSGRRTESRSAISRAVCRSPRPRSRTR